MKLYLISQSAVNECDTYDSAVVCAKSPADAKKIHPNGQREVDGSNSYTWAKDVSEVSVEFLGQAKTGSKRGVICASFNAG